MKTAFHQNALLTLILLLGLGATVITAAQTTPPPPNAVNAPASAPVVFGLVVNNNGSIRTILETIIQTTKKIAKAKQPNDEAFLVRFASSDKINVLVAATRDEAELAEGAEEMYPEGGLSANTDALYAASKEFKQQSCATGNCKQSLILISDGDERQSELKPKQLLDALKEKNIRVYAICLIENLNRNKEIKFLQNVTNQTGGKAYYPKTIEELNTNITEMMQSVRQ